MPVAGAHSGATAKAFPALIDQIALQHSLIAVERAGNGERSCGTSHPVVPIACATPSIYRTQNHATKSGSQSDPAKHSKETTMNTNRSITMAFTIAVLLTTTFSVKAGPLGASCTADLNALSAEWDAIAFQPPSKASQARVVGLNGHETTGGQFNFISAQIRLAAQACAAGQEVIAERQIDYTRTLLARTAAYDTLATGTIK